MIAELDWPILTSHIDSFFAAQIVLVILCGGVIGFERKNRRKPLGLRTSILIAMGTMLFVKYGLHLLEDYAVAGPDPTRVMGQVVSGIGFLGAGTIMNKEGLVIGLTSAATIWVIAAIGVLIAYGYLIDAIIFTLVTLAILYGVSNLEARLGRRRQKKSE